MSRVPLSPQIRRLAVFCPNLVGDTVMATPTLRALRAGFPEAHILGVIKPRVAPTLDGNPWLNAIICFDPRSEKAEHRTCAVVRRLGAERIDLAVLLPNSFRSALVAWLSGARYRLGYARGGRSALLSHRLEAPRLAEGGFLPTPAVEYYLKLARCLRCPVESARMELFTTDQDEAEADRVWNQLKIDRRQPLVCLNTGGAFGPSKNWPTTSFARLARRLVDELSVQVLVVCGPGERDNARAIVDLADHSQVVSLASAEPLSLGLTKACIRRADLLVTTDSGPRHFAAAFGTPVVSIFGPTHIAWTRTYHPQAIHLQKRLPCGPCQQPICPEGHHRCMTELSPNVVFEASARLLHTHGVPRACGLASSPRPNRGR